MDSHNNGLISAVDLEYYYFNIEVYLAPWESIEDYIAESELPYTIHSYELKVQQ